MFNNKLLALFGEKQNENRILCSKVMRIFVKQKNFPEFC